MNLITTLPLYRNNFQPPTLFFSLQNFPIGSLVFIPSPWSIKHQSKKPALVIQVEDLEKNKFFLRKNKILIKKLEPSSHFIFLKKDIIKLLLLISERKKIPLRDAFQKIFLKRDLRELNKLASLPEKNKTFFLKKITAKITSDFIKKKFKLNLPPTRNQSNNYTKEIKNISEFLSAQRIKKTPLHSEKHYLVNEIRSYFGETALRGTGSFSFYLGFFKKIPTTTLYQYWSEVKSSRKSIRDQQKFFWWKIGQHFKKEDKI